MRTFRAVAIALLGLTLGVGTVAADPGNRNYRAHMTGEDEIPVRATRAHGVATFQARDDNQALRFKLNVANIENVIAAHIHIITRADGTGPVVAFLYGNVPPGGGRIQGRISDGTLTAASLVGPLAGQPLSTLVDLMNSGMTYVNVHTNDGVGAVDTGPGDFPGGEIRGVIVRGSGND